MLLNMFSSMPLHLPKQKKKHKNSIQTLISLCWRAINPFRTIVVARCTTSMDGALEWNGDAINRREDGWINATEMCKANGKEWYEFFRTESCKKYLAALHRGNPGARDSDLPYETLGGSKRGTWVHPNLAIELARWVSPEFSVFVNQSFIKAYENQSNILPGTLEEDFAKATALAGLVEYAGGSKKDSVALSLTVLAKKYPEDRKLLLDNNRLLGPQPEDWGNVTEVKCKVEDNLSETIFKVVLDNMKRLKWISTLHTSHAINILLIKMDYQWRKEYKVATNECAWVTTERGQALGKIVDRPAINSETYRTAPQLMWRTEQVAADICRFIVNNQDDLLVEVY